MSVRIPAHRLPRATMVRTTVAVVVILIVSACVGHAEGTPTLRATLTPTTAPTTDPNRTPSAECFTPPPDLLALINQTDPLACYGSSALTVGAHVTGVGAIDCPGGLQPAWFSCEAMIELEPLAETAEAPFVLAARSSGPSLFAVLAPASGIARNVLVETDWLVTGHYDDPAAQACHYTAWPVGAGAPPPAGEVIDQCRRTFVLTAVVPLGS